MQRRLGLAFSGYKDERAWQQTIGRNFLRRKHAKRNFDSGLRNFPGRETVAWTSSSPQTAGRPARGKENYYSLFVSAHPVRHG